MPFSFNPFTVNLDKISDLSAYVPYTGATANVDLDTYSLSAEGITINSSGNPTWSLTEDSAYFAITQLVNNQKAQFNLGAFTANEAHIYSLPTTDGTIALTSDIPSITNLATKALDNLASVAMNASLQWKNTAARTFDIAPTANTVAGRALTISAGSTVTGGTADMVGGNLILNAGLGKGTGASVITFSTGRTLTTGSTLQTLTEAMRIDGTGAVSINNTNGVVPLSVAQLTSYSTPTTNTRNGAFTVGNTTNAYGMIFGVDTATGKAYISSQRFSGGAANYALCLNPLGVAAGTGHYVVIGSMTGLVTTDGSLSLPIGGSSIVIKGGGNQNTELAGDHLKVGQAAGLDTGYFYAKSDNSVGAALYWGKTSGAGVSFANSDFIPTTNFGMNLGYSSFRWASLLTQTITANATNVGFLDATSPFDVGTGRGLHIKSDQLPTLLLQGYYKDGTTTSYNSQVSFYYSATSQTRILYDPGAAIWNFQNEVSATDATHAYGDTIFKSKTAGGTTLVEALRIRGYNGNIGINTGINPPVKLTVYDTAEQLRTGYSSTQYLSHTTDSTGISTINPVGTTPYLLLNKQVYGSAYMDDGSTTVTLTNANTAYSLAAGLTGGLENGMTFQNSKEIKVLIAGKYKAEWSASVSLSASDQTIEGKLMGGASGATELVNTSNATRAKENGVVYSVSGTGYITCAVNDLIRIGFENETSAGTTLTVNHVNITLLRIDS